MISKLFRKPTVNEFLSELKKSTLKESKVESYLPHVDINHLNQSRQSFLHIMIEEKKIESIKWLLQNGINPNVTDAKGNTPLMLASKVGFLEAVEELLNFNANVNLNNNSGFSAVEFSVFNNHFKIYKLLKPLLNDINRKNKNDQTILALALKAGSLDIVENLINDNRVILDEEILFNKNSYKKETITKKLFEEFDYLDLLDKYNRNVLFYIVENGLDSQDLFLDLIEDGLEINTIDEFGNNILLHLIEEITKKRIKKMMIYKK